MMASLWLSEIEDLQVLLVLLLSGRPLIPGEVYTQPCWKGRFQGWTFSRNLRSVF